MTSRALLLFARTPEAEAAAKGLAKGAAALFEALIASWLRVAEDAGATAVIACEPAARARHSAIAPRQPRAYVDQTGKTFGERLANAAAACRNFDAVIIAGIDAPPMDLTSAFAKLESGEADGVIAPAKDGGINGIGYAVAPLELLAGFEIGDRSLAARCIAAFDKIHILERCSDIDSPTRIRSARHERLWIPYRPLLREQIDNRAPVWFNVRFIARTTGARPPPN